MDSYTGGHTDSISQTETSQQTKCAAIHVAIMIAYHRDITESKVGSFTGDHIDSISQTEAQEQQQSGTQHKDSLRTVCIKILGA